MTRKAYGSDVFDAEWKLRSCTWKLRCQFQDLRAKFLKRSISCKKNNSTNRGNIVLNAISAACPQSGKFVLAIADVVEDFGFDGVDIYFEY